MVILHLFVRIFQSIYLRIFQSDSGYLLAWLSGNVDETLKGITHLVIDEIHERTISVDFLMCVIKSKLSQYRKLKIILMSATLRTELFQAYFENSVTIQIPGRTYEVDVFYLGGILKMINGKNSTQSEQQLEEAYEAQFSFNKEHFEDLNAIADLIAVLHNAKPLDEAILVFLPGAGDIELLYTKIEEKITTHDYKLFVLHSQVQHGKEVFAKFSQLRKIVLATNIAETSVTIEDAVNLLIYY